MWRHEQGSWEGIPTTWMPPGWRRAVVDDFGNAVDPNPSMVRDFRHLVFQDVEHVGQVDVFTVARGEPWAAGLNPHLDRIPSVFQRFQLPSGRIVIGPCP